MSWDLGRNPRGSPRAAAVEGREGADPRKGGAPGPGEDAVCLEERPGPIEGDTGRAHAGRRRASYYSGAGRPGVEACSTRNVWSRGFKVLLGREAGFILGNISLSSRYCSLTQGQH